MKTSEEFALYSWLSYFPENMTYDEIIEAMTDHEESSLADEIDPWGIVEGHDYSYIAQLIEDTKTHFEQAAKVEVNEYKTALQELLNYTGGWDITDKEHPIYKARAMLNKN